MRKKILAVSSGGGHWVQLLRLRPVLDEHNTTYVTVQSSYAAQVEGKPFYVVKDATRWDKLALIWMILQVCLIVLRVRPDVVITTGAAPGVAALRMGKLLGAKTVWLDSIANVEHISMSGEKVGPFVDLWLTQWEHLAGEDGPSYFGGVI